MGVVFLIAFLFYFVRSYLSTEKLSRSYEAIGNSILPLLYVNDGTVDYNPLYGYFQDLKTEGSEEAITSLPEDRLLQLHMTGNTGAVQSIHYELRSLDGKDLIEKGDGQKLERKQDGLHLVLPIQNLIQDDTPYLLTITMDTGEQQVHYYTRVIHCPQDPLKEMRDLALQFSNAIYDKNAARQYTMYLETDDTEDNSDLSHVTLHGSYSQLTYGDSGMQTASAPALTVKELDNNMAEIRVERTSSCNDKDGNRHDYLVTENFILRKDTQRLYLMNYDRVMEERVDAGSYRFKNELLKLGIQREANLKVFSSASGEFHAFTTSLGLYCYDNTNHSFVSIYQKIQGKNPEVPRGTTRLKILSVKDNGDVDFLVLGYVDRGIHEGNVGVQSFTYDNSANILNENFFLSLPENAEKLIYDAGKLSYQNPKSVFYLYYQNNVYGIDTNSLEVVTVASDLPEGAFAASRSGRFIAYQESSSEDLYHAEKIHYMDLQNGSSRELSEEGKRMRTIGFIGEDFVYGLIDQSFGDTMTDRQEVPVKFIRILGADQQQKNDYQREGIFFGDMELTAMRVHFNEYRQNGERFDQIGDDSIISNEPKDMEEKQQLDSHQETGFEKVYGFTIAKLKKNSVSSRVPGQVSVSELSSLELSQDRKEGRDRSFYAYRLGSLWSRENNITSAYEKVHESYGYVIDHERNIVWNRVDKPGYIMNNGNLEVLASVEQDLPRLKTFSENDSARIYNISGFDLNSALYYVGKGGFVLLYKKDGTRQLFIGYTSTMVTMEDVNGAVSDVSRQAAENLCRDNGNRFIAVVPKKTGN